MRKKIKDFYDEAEIDQTYVLELAWETYGWTNAKILSWYKKENRNLGGASPKELVDRGEGLKVVEFLAQKSFETNRQPERGGKTRS